VIRVVALLAVLVVPGVAAAAEITVLCARGMQHVVAAAAEEFQRTTKHSVWFSYGTTGGILGRVVADPADIVIASAAGVADLESKGAVELGTRVLLGRVGIGVATRVGAPRIDISSAALLRRAILAATSLGYADPVAGGQAGRHFAHVLASIGIAPLVGPKTTLFPDGLRALQSVAKGETDLAVAPISAILGVEGVALAGPLPDALQQVLVYGAAVLVRSSTPDVAKAFLRHLKSAEVRARFKAGGIDD
jgi:molybdate transport system substrate-binding protein